MLIVSVLFYAWGEQEYVLLLLGSILINYIGGLFIHRSKDNVLQNKVFLTLFISINLIVLVYFKYTYFLIDLANDVGTNFDLVRKIYLPLGISFFTFQAISYLVDVYRQKVMVQNNPIDLGLYISLFPQLIAGPIVRYSEISQQIKARETNLKGINQGVQRFIIGLSKKVIIANNLALISDHIFALPPDTLPMGVAWLGAITFSLQIYFDFSGYSDMAIGIGLMLGFKIPENFNFPYIANSIRDFWRRWHMTLSRWFRDYLYIPLGGNRKGPSRTYLNLFCVFLLCGLWHGANLTFVLWGFLHGLFLMLERKYDFTSKLPVVLNHVYVIIILLFTWVLFRSDSIGRAGDFMAAMLNFSEGTDYSVLFYFSRFSMFILVLSIVLSIPIFKNFEQKVLIQEEKTRSILYAILCLILFAICLSEIAISAYQPFIYFRF